MQKYKEMIYKPEACRKATSPILLVTLQSSFKVIFDSAKGYKCLLHASVCGKLLKLWRIP